MSTFETPNQPEKGDAEYLEDIHREAKHVLEELRASGIFDDSYLHELRLVFFSQSRKNAVLQSDALAYDSKNQYTDMRGFELGLRTDFTALVPKEEYEAEYLLDDQRIQELFCTQRFPYAEFAAHEIAHNVFDKAYIRTYGDYAVYEEQNPDTKEIEGEITDCSEAYKAKIADALQELFNEQHVPLAADAFFDATRIGRQKIAEIFALMVQREFSRKTNQPNCKEHEAMDARTKAVLADPQKAIDAYNQKTGRKVTQEDMYRENHVLSFIAVPLLEKKYPDFKERLKFFCLKTQGLISKN
jgi:hypothetical protein